MLIWINLAYGNAYSIVAGAVAALALVGGLAANRVGREGWAFVGTALAITFFVAGAFLALFPDVMPSYPNPENSLTVANASSTPYTLTIMTWAAAFLTPVVIAYHRRGPTGPSASGSRCTTSPTNEVLPDPVKS